MTKKSGANLYITGETLRKKSKWGIPFTGKEKMTKIKDTPDVDLSAPVTVSGADLLALFVQLQQQQAKQAAESNKVLAEAFAESRKPYKDPGNEANLAESRKQIRQIQLNILRSNKIAQKNCPHEQGQKGNRRSGEGAFAALKLPTGEAIGICTYCFKTISSADPRHAKYFQKLGGSMAESGQFMLTNPLEAQLARLSPDEREKVMKARSEMIKPQTFDDNYLDD